MEAKSLVPSKYGDASGRREECYDANRGSKDLERLAKAYDKLDELSMSLPDDIIIQTVRGSFQAEAEATAPTNAKSDGGAERDGGNPSSKDLKRLAKEADDKLDELWMTFPDDIIQMVRRSFQAEAELTAPTNAKSYGGAFRRCEWCYEYLPIALIVKHSCNKKNSEAQVVEIAPEVKKKLAERDGGKPSSEVLERLAKAHAKWDKLWRIVPDDIIQMTLRSYRAEAEATAPTNAKSGGCAYVC